MFSIIATVMILPLMEYLKEEDVEFTVDLVENYIAFVLTYFLLGMLIRTHNQLFYRISKVLFLQHVSTSEHEPVDFTHSGVAFSCPGQETPAH